MLYEISCNIGSRYNGIPLYIYLTYTLCIMAVILQTRCFQMDNCEPDLSFSKYVELDCFRWLYIYGHICDFLSRFAQLKQYILLQSKQPGDWHQMKTTGPQEQDDWTVWNTVNWWILTGRDDVTKRQELQILLMKTTGPQEQDDWNVWNTVNW